MRTLSQYKSRTEAWIRKGHHNTPINQDDFDSCKCLNCGTIFKGNYCPECGQSSKTKRLTIANAFESIVAIFTNMDSKFLHTLVDLFTRPGYLVRDYISGRRVEYFKPVPMLFFIATIYLIINTYILGAEPNTEIADKTLDISSHGVKLNVEDNAMWRWLKYIAEICENKAIYNLLLTLLAIIPMKLCVNRTTYGKTLNITEVFTYLMFLACQSLVIEIAFLPITHFAKSDVLLAGIINYAMQFWTFKQMFRTTWWRTIKLYIYYILLITLFSIITFICIYFILDLFHITDIQAMQEAASEIDEQ